MVNCGETQVAVVGGGPAGLAAAIAARLAGFDVCVLDRAAPLIDKACGEGLMPDGLDALAKLGVSVQGVGVPFRGIRFIDGEHVADGSFGTRVGYGLRRTQLHQLLVDRARAIGVRTLWRTKVINIESEAVVLDSGLLRCKWIIGADGTQSKVRRWSGLEESNQLRSKRIGLRQHFRVTPWTDFVEVYCAKRGQAYVTPIGSDEIGIVLLGDDGALNFENVETNFPLLGAKLKGSEPTSALRGAPTGIIRLGRVTRGNMALIGDASATIDAISGDGLALAFYQAVALGAALQRGDLGRYEAHHRQICQVPFMMAQLLLLMGRKEGLRKLTLKTLSSRPRTLNGLLAAHVNEKPALAASIDVAALGLGILTESIKGLSKAPYRLQ